MENQKIKENFYFHPQNHGYSPNSITDVHIIGEFNDWGKKLSSKHRLTKDKTGRWVGVFELEQGAHPYKFLLNKNTYCPKLGMNYYSTVKTPDWAKNRVWYQIFPDRFYRGGDTPVKNLISWDEKPNFFDNFGGNLLGIKEKISYFKELYGDLKNFAIYLNPLHLSSASNHKYWPEDFEKIDPQFGTEEDFKALIDEIHLFGGKIIIDLVYNHTGLNHYAFQDILLNGKKSQYLSWYRDLPDFSHEKIHIPCLQCTEGNVDNIEIISGSDNEAAILVWGGKYAFPLTNYKEGMSFDEVNSSQPYYKLTGIHSHPNYASWWGLYELPELNTEDLGVKKNLFSASRKWIKAGIDGFRLDVPDTLNNAHEFWREFRQVIRYEAALNNRNPDDLYVVGEIWTNEGITGSFTMADKTGRPIRYDSIMNYPIREAVLNHYSGQILTPATDRVSYDGEISVSQMDINIQKDYAHIPFGTNQVQMNCFSSHDTRRLRSVLGDDKKLRACLLMQFTLMGLPSIYYGDEVGMHGWVDPDNRATMRWEILENLEKFSQEKEIFDYYKRLIGLRKNYKCLIEAPVLTLLTDDFRNLYSYSRHLTNSDSLIVLTTKQEQSEDVVLDISGVPVENIHSWQNLLSDKKYHSENRKLIIPKEDLNKNYCVLLAPQV